MLFKILTPLNSYLRLRLLLQLLSLVTDINASVCTEKCGTNDEDEIFYPDFEYEIPDRSLEFSSIEPVRNYLTDFCLGYPDSFRGFCYVSGASSVQRIQFCCIRRGNRGGQSAHRNMDERSMIVRLRQSTSKKTSCPVGSIVYCRKNKNDELIWK